MSRSEQVWSPLRPKLGSDGAAADVFLWLIQELEKHDRRAGDESTLRLASIRTEGLRRAETTRSVCTHLRVIVSVLCDLAAKGWEFRWTKSGAEIRTPLGPSGVPRDEKSRVRDSLLVERDSQLRQASVRAFVRDMEKRRLAPCGWASIYSLIRDGRDLAHRLREADRESEEEARATRLREAIDPYLQFVNGDECCEFTGRRLIDIWRYFRHTWVTPYTLPPGRKILILVRDRAAANHPVIGIAALGNAVVQLGPRDEWIGWTPRAFLGRLQSEPSRAWAEWLHQSVEDLFDGIYIDDLLEDGLVGEAELKRPSTEVIKRLGEEAAKAREAHGVYPEVDMHKSAESGDGPVDWVQKARTNLFRFKRAGLLAQLLQVRRLLLDAGFDSPTREDLIKVLGSTAGKRAIEIVLRRVKAVHVGVDMLDIVVCGAVAPYQPILGGKLIAMLLASPEVVLEYHRRYKSAISVIASSIAGRAVTRRPHLVLLSTTSLYGVGSSMYNRISIPAEEVGGQPGTMIRYEKLGKSVGFGSIQFSPETISQIQTLLTQSSRGRPVNSIFGEGVSPRLRKVRSGLDLVGLPSDLFLQHGDRRIVYGIALAERFREILIGYRDRVAYIAPLKNSRGVTSRVAAYWIRRWLSNRIRDPQVLNEVEQHTLIYPIDHGARVQLPPLEAENDEMPLFPTTVNRR